MHWDNIITALIASVPPTIVAMAAYRAADKSHTVGKENQNSLKEVEKSVDGILAQRVTAAKAEGKIDEQNAQANREASGTKRT